MACLTSNQLCNVACISYNAGLRCCGIGCCLGPACSGLIVGKEGSSLLIMSPSTCHAFGCWCIRSCAVTFATAGYNPATYGEPGWFVPRMIDLKFTAQQNQAFAMNNLYCGTYWSDERFACNGPSNSASGVNSLRLQYGGYPHTYSCYILALRRLYY